MGTYMYGRLVGFMVFNTTFNNISVISWRSVLLVEKTTDLSQVIDKLYHIMLYTSPWSGFELTSVVIGTDCIGSCKSNYCTITATWIQRDMRLKIFKIYRKFLHDSLYEENLDQPLGRALHVYGISEIW